jgi:ABC-type Fe3+ transport system permease subunit
MIHKIKFMLLSLSTMVALAVPAMVGSTVSAQNTPTINPQTINSQLCSGSNGGLGGRQDTGCDPGDAATAGNTLIQTVVNILSVVVGAIAVIMIIYAGFRYVTSGGRDEAVKGAKNTILYAIIGLVIVALAQIIVHFVIAKAGEAVQ